MLTILWNQGYYVAASVPDSMGSFNSYPIVRQLDFKRISDEKKRRRQEAEFVLLLAGLLEGGH